MPPDTSSLASGCAAESFLIAESTRINSALENERISISRVASAGTVLVVVPACMTVGTTVVPNSGFANFATSITIEAISIVALIPFSGSSPA